MMVTSKKKPVFVRFLKKLESIFESKLNKTNKDNLLTLMRKVIWNILVSLLAFINISFLKYNAGTAFFFFFLSLHVLIIYAMLALLSYHFLSFFILSNKLLTSSYRFEVLIPKHNLGHQ